VGDADSLREQLRQHENQGKRDGVLLMLDINGFHMVNRIHGQRDGDRVLQAVTVALRQTLRQRDSLCRYAGDRFGALLPATDLDTARALAEQLTRAVADLRITSFEHKEAIPVSVRFAVRALDDEPRQLLKETNRALERRMAPAPAERAHASVVTLV